MKAILLAALATVLTFGAAVLIFSAARIERRALTLLLIYLLIVCGLAAVSLATPPDLGFLPLSVVAQPAWLDFLAALFFYSAAFFGGILQLYNLADRGLSLRILIDATERAQEGATSKELFDGYSAGRGLTWMYDKRIEGMVGSGLVRIEDADLVLTERGGRTADVYTGLRRLFGTAKE